MKRILTGLALIVFLVAALAGGAAARDKDTLIVAQETEPVGLDTTRNNLHECLNVSHNIQDRLFEPQEDASVTPALAEKWEWTDETSLKIWLRKGATFHNGEPVNAAAVKFSYDRLLNPELKSPHRGRMVAFTGLEVVDDYTLVLKTAQPFAPALHLLSYYLPIVPPKYVKEVGDEMYNRKPVGAGPYKVVSWEKGKDIVLEYYEGWYGPKPAYKHVIFRAIPEEAARVASVLTGESDVVEGLSLRSQMTVSKSDKAYTTSGMGVMPYMGLNTYQKPFSDERVRQALNYGINRPLINKTIFEGQGILAAGPISPRSFGADLSLKPYPYDPDKAKKLLAEAGYPDGFEARLSYPTNMQQIQEQAQVIAGDLAKIGVKVQLQPLDPPVMWQKYKGREHQMYIYWWDDNPESDRYMFSLLHSKSRDYYYKNEETDRLLDAARSTLDREKRAKLYNEVDRKLYKECPWVFLYIVPKVYGVNNKVDYQGRRDGFLFMRFAKPKS